jgi:hypothetical protein
LSSLALFAAISTAETRAFAQTLPRSYVPFETVQPAIVQPRFNTASLRARFGVAQWASRLAAPDASSRAAAVRVLARYTPQGSSQDEVVELLAERLRSEAEPDVQLAIVDALRELATDRAIAALVPLVCTRGALAPRAAQRALAFVGPQLDRDGIDSILNGLVGTTFNGSQELRDAALDAVAAAPDEPFSDRVAAHRATPVRLAILLETIGRRGDGRWGAAVLEQLQSPQRIVVLAAIRASAQLRLLESASPIARLVREHTNDTDNDLRLVALDALAIIGAGDPEQTREALKLALRAPALAMHARRAIAALGMRSLVPDVAAGLDAAWRVDRREIAETLADIGGPEAARALLTALERETDDVARRVLWRSVVRADETSARRALESAAEGDRSARWAALDLVVRRAAAPRMRGLRALAQSGDVAAMALECAANRCESAVARLGDADVARRTDAAWALTFAPSVDQRTTLARFEAETDAAVKTLLAFALMRANGDGAAVTAAFERFALRTDQALTIDQAVVAELAGRRGSTTIRRAIPAMIEDRRASVRALGLWLGARTSDHATIATAARWSAESADVDVRRVAAAVAGAASRRGVVGTGVLHAMGMQPRSLWLAWMPDGQVVVCVATSEGTLLVPDVPSETFDLESAQ